MIKVSIKVLVKKGGDEPLLMVIRRAEETVGRFWTRSSSVTNFRAGDRTTPRLELSGAKGEHLTGMSKMVVIAARRWDCFDVRVVMMKQVPR